MYCTCMCVGSSTLGQNSSSKDYCVKPSIHQESAPPCLPPPSHACHPRSTLCTTVQKVSCELLHTCMYMYSICTCTCIHNSLFSRQGFQCLYTCISLIFLDLYGELFIPLFYHGFNFWELFILTFLWQF